MTEWERRASKTATTPEAKATRCELTRQVRKVLGDDLRSVLTRLGVSSKWDAIIPKLGRHKLVEIHPSIISRVGEDKLTRWMQVVLEARLARLQARLREDPLSVGFWMRRWPETRKRVESLVYSLVPKVNIVVMHGPGRLRYWAGKAEISVPLDWPLKIKDPALKVRRTGRGFRLDTVPRCYIVLEISRGVLRTSRELRKRS
jgi:hypothetical protein